MMLIERALDELNLRGTRTDLRETRLICHEAKTKCEERFKEDEEEAESARIVIDKENKRLTPSR